jgi:hypothetical protein
VYPIPLACQHAQPSLPNAERNLRNRPEVRVTRSTAKSADRYSIELLRDADLDDQIENVLHDYGINGWELVQVLHRHKVPEDPIYRLIFKSEQPFMQSGQDPDG